MNDITTVPNLDSGKGATLPNTQANTSKRSFKSLLVWESGLFVVLVASVIGGSILSPQFLTAGNILNLQLSIGEIAIMALPLALIVITGEIDLSVASILGLSSSLVGYLWMHHVPMSIALSVVLVVGALLGLFNGVLVTRLGLPSLAVTIGTLALYRGVALVILGSNIVSNFPPSYTSIGVNSIPGFDISYSMFVFIVLAVIFGLVVHFTPFGRSLFAIGLNKEAAAYAGIRVKRTKTTLYVLSGVICALAGVLYTFRLSTAEYNNGSGLELNAVSLVLLAGVSIFGGRGSILGVVLAVATLGTIQNGLLLTTFPQQAMGVVVGGLLLISVFVPNASLIRRQFQEFKFKKVAKKRSNSGESMGDLETKRILSSATGGKGDMLQS